MYLCACDSEREREREGERVLAHQEGSRKGRAAKGLTQQGIRKNVPAGRIGRESSISVAFKALRMLALRSLGIGGLYILDWPREGGE